MSRRRTGIASTPSVLLSYACKGEGETSPGFKAFASLQEVAVPAGSDGTRSGNILVEGDNLPALESLLRRPELAGHVRLVYIDPPFASGQEFRSGAKRSSTVSASSDDPVAYQDHLQGAEFLEFLRRRLIPLREILAEDGSIYLHIDAKMGHYVKVLMDEVFGREQFINDITRIKCNPKNFSRRGYGNVKDMILFYSKSKRFLWNEPRVGLSQG